RGSNQRTNRAGVGVHLFQRACPAHRMIVARRSIRPYFTLPQDVAPFAVTVTHQAEVSSAAKIASLFAPLASAPEAISPPVQLPERTVHVTIPLADGVMSRSSRVSGTASMSAAPSAMPFTPLPASRRSQ